jgi:hypothetical protein
VPGEEERRRPPVRAVMRIIREIAHLHQGGDFFRRQRFERYKDALA